MLLTRKSLVANESCRYYDMVSCCELKRNLVDMIYPN